MKLWTEVWRPVKANDYIYCDASQRRQIQSWINDGGIPHILLGGGPGVGKTTLARLLIAELGIHPGDVIELNASRERGIEVLRGKVTNFAGTVPLGSDFKVILLDESDFLTLDAQASLRGIMEQYADNCRFILTCNHPNKIMPAIHSRCHVMMIDKLDKTTFTERSATILASEGVDFDLDTLDSYVTATYPDMRKCLNALQQNSYDSKLHKPSENELSSTEDYLVQAVDMFKNGKITEGRRLIVSNAVVGDVDNIIRWCYNNLELWSDTQAGQDKAVRIIRDALVNHTLVADPEINLAAMMVELTTIE